MQQVQHDQAAQTERPEKKPYIQPKLVRHGMVEQVTQGGGIFGDGGASGPIG